MKLLTTRLGKLCLATVVAAGFIGSAHARDEIRIVGSSTVYPFSSAAAEELGALTDHRVIVESTGSGGGMKLFCAGTGAKTPDITNASRRMKKKEYEKCQKNGVTEISEIVLGYDGIVIASKKGAEPVNFTRKQILMAVAAEVPQDGKLVPNPYTRWNQIDASLPDQEIIIYGPPKSSGTRDAFQDLVMKASAKKIQAYIDADPKKKGKYKKVRQDGVYVPAGENDNLIVQKLNKNPKAFGIFGYSFLEENREKIQASTVDGVQPEAAKISSGEYPVSRSLYFYVKQAHMGVIDGIEDYVDLFLDEEMIGVGGYMTELGLIPLPAKQRANIRSVSKNRSTLKM